MDNDVVPEVETTADEYRLLVERSVDVLFHTVDGVVTLISPSVEQLLGYRPEELVGSTTAHLWHPDDLVVAVDLRDSVYGGGAGQVRGRLRHRDGHFVDVQTSLSPVEEPDGRTGAVGSITDVTDLVDAERQREEEAAAFRQLAEHAADVVFRASNDGVVEWISPTVEAVLGRPVAELVDNTFQHLVHPDDRTAFGDAQKAVAAGEPRVVDMRVQHQDGTYRWVSAAVHPVVGADGRVVGRAGGWRLVDAEHAARRALEESEERLRLLLEHAPVGMCVVAPDGRFEMVNPALCAIFGRDVDELMASTWQQLTHPDDLAADTALVEQVLDGRRDDYRLRKRYLDSAGNVVWGDLSVAAVRGADGAVEHLVAQILDVTKLVAAQDKLAASEAHYRMLAEHSTDMVVRSGQDHTVEWVSPSASTFGWTPDDLIGTPLVDLVHPGDRSSVAAGRRWLYSGDLDVDPDDHFLVRFLAASGDYRWVDGSATRVVAGPGPASMVTCLRDVHELVTTRSRAEADRLRLGATLDALADPLVVLEAVRGVNGEVTDLELVSANLAVAAVAPGMAALTPGTRLGELGLGGGMADVVAMCRDVAATKAAAAQEVRVGGGLDGAAERVVDVRVNPVDDGVVCTWRDMTEPAVAQAHLRASEERVRTVVEAAPVATALLDDELRIEEANPALCSLLGADRTWLVGRHLSDIEPDGAPGAGGPERGPVETRLRRADGTEAWVERSVVPAGGREGDGRTYFVAQFIDVQQARQHREELAYEATHDAMTGLLNRRELLRRLERILSHPARRDGLLGVLALDVDNLKPVNDQLGHPAGDQLIVGTADRIRTSLRDDDVVARVGGDEFVALLPGATSLDVVTHVAEKVLTAAGMPMELDGHVQDTSLSIGATVARPGEDPAEVLARADNALLQAKATGRARCVAVGSVEVEVVARDE